MQRDNYYIILDLSVDPPENDPKVIEKAIQNKKVEWSRLRNHPTKGLQIQKLINLIPDIQQVMQDDTLRENEAQAALGILEAGKENKLSEIDGHIDILMGKGFISKEDVVRLSEIHGLPQSEINERVAAKQNTTYARVDQFISLRMGKGYLLEDEVARIAKKHGMDPEEVRKRVRCPIVKDDKEVENLKIRPLDKSLEKSVNENLRVVGKTSLYDFLSTPESTDLPELREKAGKKKKSLGTLGRKDAIVTAGITLAGQCLTIFKNNETRIAYDVSLASAKLASLDSDINVAATNKKIRYEYFDALIKKAMDFGMDKEEASSYILSYCQKKKIRVEEKPKNKRIILIAAAASVIGVIILIAGGIVFSKIHHKTVVESEYRNLVEKVAAQNDADQKIGLLKKYVATHSAGAYADDARDRITQIERQIDASEFSSIMEQTDQLIQAQKLEESLSVLNQYAEKTNDPENKKTITRQIQQVSDLIEQRDFDELTNIALTGSPDQKIKTFQTYLETHPNGKNKEKVQSLITEISDEYFIYVSKMLAVYERSEQWEACVRLCQSYIDLYDNSHSDQLKQRLPIYQEYIRNEKIYAALVEKATALGTDYHAAMQIFKDYRDAYPKSSITEKIDQEIDRLNQLISIQNTEKAANSLRERLAKSSGRFVEEQPGVVVDTDTGLMWCMVDTTITHTRCTDYEYGKQYVESLTIGGFSDWRLPTPKELAGIYKTDPAFPATVPTSYWTSESYSGYSDGWQVQVTTLSSEDAIHWEIMQKNALECGAVRAVRNP